MTTSSSLRDSDPEQATATAGGAMLCRSKSHRCR